MIEIQVTITLRSPLNIGAGAQQGTLAQRGMLKDRDGWPYIPATTLKGKLRHAVEQVASTLPNAGLVFNPHDYTVPLREDVVSRLFGTPWQPGLVIFGDCLLSGPPELAAYKENNSHPRTTERTGVSINRRRRVAADQRLYNTELLWPGAPFEFRGTIRGDLDKGQTGLLIAGLRLIPAVGGGKTGGLGWITVQTSIDAGGEVWTQPELLAAVKEAYGE